MYKLALAPDQQQYATAEGTRQVYSKLDGGLGRYRRDLLNGTYKVDVQWTVGDADFVYLNTFYRVVEGVNPFLMDLILDAAVLTEHECRFIPGTFRLTSIKGEQYTVRAQLEVRPAIADDEFDAGLVTTYESFGPEGPQAYASLAYLVNVSMPANMK